MLLILIAYLGFSWINNAIKSNKDIKEITDTTKSLTNQPNLTIQIDVQNGTVENGVALIFSDYLRKNGMDVVEMGNYKSNDMERTLIIDRIGDRNKAKRIALLLGLNERNIIQQINRSLILDVTVVIGKDFKELKPFAEKNR